MTNCKDCTTNCVYRGKDNEARCGGFVGTITNADRIRAMSDEELEEEFTKGGLCRYIQDHDNEFCDERGDCTNCIKEWLKQPVGDAEINA